MTLRIPSPKIFSSQEGRRAAASMKWMKKTIWSVNIINTCGRSASDQIFRAKGTFQAQSFDSYQYVVD